MEIVSIFAENLYSFRYTDGDPDEFERLFDRWTDIEFLHSFFEENKADMNSGFWPGTSVEQAALDTFREARLFEDQILEMAENSTKGQRPNLDVLFRPLENLSSGFVELSFSKAYGYNKPSWLRIYAIKLDSNVYVVTGGAIKLTQKMNRPHLISELNKLKRCKEWLKKQGVYDQDGLQELI